MTVSVRLWRAPPTVYPTTTSRRQVTQRTADARRGIPAEPGAGGHPSWIPVDEHAEGAHEDASEHAPATHERAEAEPPDATPDAPATDPTSAMANRLLRTCSEISVGNTITEHLARLLSQFCGSRIVKSSSECWEVTLDLDPRVLPETRLTLQLSPHTLWLRFHAGHPRARDLLSEHGDALRQRIHVLLEQRIDVELELW